MTKDDINKICNSVYIKILSSDYDIESIKKKLLPFTTNGKIKTEELALFVLLESQKFTVKMIQDVLSEVLISDNTDSICSENDSINSLTSK